MPKEVIISSDGLTKGAYVRLFTFDLDDIPDIQVYFHGAGGYIYAAKTFHANSKCGLQKRKRKGGTPISARNAVKEGLLPCKRCKPLGDFPFQPPIERFRTRDGRYLDTLESNRYINDIYSEEMSKSYSGNLSDKLGEVQSGSKANQLSTTYTEEIEVRINDLGHEEFITFDPREAVAVLNRVFLQPSWSQLINLLREISRTDALSNLVAQHSLSVPLLPNNENVEKSLKTSVKKVIGDNVRFEVNIEGKTFSLTVFPTWDSVLHLHHVRQELNLFGSPSALDCFVIEFDSGGSSLSLLHTQGNNED